MWKFSRPAALLGLALSLATVMGGGADATDPPKMEPLEFISLAYLGAYNYDFCVDEKLGAGYRVVLQNVIRECHPSQQLQERLTRQMRKIDSVVADIMSEKIPFPTKRDSLLFRDTRQCNDLLHDPYTLQLRRKLTSYADHRATANDAIGYDCQGHRLPDTK